MLDENSAEDELILPQINVNTSMLNKSSNSKRFFESNFSRETNKSISPSDYAQAFNEISNAKMRVMSRIEKLKNEKKNNYDNINKSPKPSNHYNYNDNHKNKLNNIENSTYKNNSIKSNNNLKNNHYSKNIYHDIEIPRQFYNISPEYYKMSNKIPINQDHNLNYNLKYTIDPRLNDINQYPIYDNNNYVNQLLNQNLQLSNSYLTGLAHLYNNFNNSNENEKIILPNILMGMPVNHDRSEIKGSRYEKEKSSKNTYISKKEFLSALKTIIKKKKKYSDSSYSENDSNQTSSKEKYEEESEKESESEEESEDSGKKGHSKSKNAS